MNEFLAQDHPEAIAFLAAFEATAPPPLPPAPWVDPKPLLPVEDLTPVHWVPGWKEYFTTNPGFLAQHFALRDATPSHLHYLSQEADFKAVGERPDQRMLGDAHARREIGLGKKPCPVCNDLNRVEVPCRGAKTGVQVLIPFACPCQPWRKFYGWWSRHVPTRFEAAAFLTAKPRADQVKIFEQMKADPKASYLLLGAPGRGKTWLAYYLLSRAVMRQFYAQTQTYIGNIWQYQTSELLDLHVAFERRDTGDSLDRSTIKPPLTVGMIEVAVQQGHRPVLMLDELDRFNPTTFKIERLMQLVDCVYRNGGQIIATANRSPEEMAERWKSEDAFAVLRRIASDGGHLIEV